MKLFFTFLTCIGFLNLANAQNGWDRVEESLESTDSATYIQMNPEQLRAYRQRIWDNVPAAVGWVNDFGLLYTQAQEDSLESMIAQFEKETTVEIIVVTIDSLMVERANFNEFTYRLLKLWGIGKITKSNGMVICISKDERKIHISTDFGIDRFIDAYDKDKIITKSFIPQFKKENYFKGSYNGVTAIIEKINKTWGKYNNK